MMSFIFCDLDDASQQSYVTIYKNAFLIEIEEILHLKDQINSLTNTLLYEDVNYWWGEDFFLLSN